MLNTHGEKMISVTSQPVSPPEMIHFGTCDECGTSGQFIPSTRGFEFEIRQADTAALDYLEHWGANARVRWSELDTMTDGNWVIENVIGNHTSVMGSGATLREAIRDAMQKSPIPAAMENTE
jgi:hypothetical protein